MPQFWHNLETCKTMQDARTLLYALFGGETNDLDNEFYDMFFVGEFVEMIRKMSFRQHQMHQSTYSLLLGITIWWSMETPRLYMARTNLTMFSILFASTAECSKNVAAAVSQVGLLRFR